MCSGGLLLCSDGVYSLLTGREMATIVDRLVSRANEEGRHDNSTAVVLSVGEQSDGPSGSDN